MRFRERVTETAGFYNTVGFNGDTRAFLSIPARHLVARRIDRAYLANLVSDHRLDEDEASELARDPACRLVKQVYRLQGTKDGARPPFRCTKEDPLHVLGSDVNLPA